MTCCNGDDYLGSKRLLSAVEDTIESIKKRYSEFYYKNIGDIDKTAPNKLEDYILTQTAEPLGNCTIRLEKNFYVMQKEIENKEYFYLPFEKVKTPQLPYRDDEAMAEIQAKYYKYKPLRKKGLLERIYEKNNKLLVSKKITKKYFFNEKIEDLKIRLEELNISDLTEALNFYDITKKTTTRAKTIKDAELIVQSKLYEEFLYSRNKLADCDTHEALKIFDSLSKDVSKYLDSFDLNELSKNEVISSSTSEDIRCVAMPKAEYMLDSFFKKDIDFGAIRKDMRIGKLDEMEMKTSFKFFSPCSNLSEVVDRFSSIDYFLSSSKTNDFEQEQTIILK